MSDDLKALHEAVKELLKARRQVRRAEKAYRSNRGWMAGATGWEGLHLTDQLGRDVDSAARQHEAAETEVVTRWEALNWPA